MHDPVQGYNRYEALAVGRLLEELNYAWFDARSVPSIWKVSSTCRSS